MEKDILAIQNDDDACNGRNRSVPCSRRMDYMLLAFALSRLEFGNAGSFKETEAAQRGKTLTLSLKDPMCIVSAGVCEDQGGGARFCLVDPSIHLLHRWCGSWQFCREILARIPILCSTRHKPIEALCLPLGPCSMQSNSGPSTES